MEYQSRILTPKLHHAAWSPAGRITWTWRFVRCQGHLSVSSVTARKRVCACEPCRLTARSSCSHTGPASDDLCATSKLGDPESQRGSVIKLRNNHQYYVRRKFLKLVVKAYVDGFNKATLDSGICPSEWRPEIHVLPPVEIDDTSCIGCACWYKYRVSGKQEGQDTYGWALGKLNDIDFTVQPPSYEVQYVREFSDGPAVCFAQTERNRIMPAGFPRLMLGQYLACDEGTSPNRSIW